jgi:hypothetical protein
MPRLSPETLGLTVPERAHSRVGGGGISRCPVRGISAAATPATVHSDAARAGVCIRKCSNRGGTSGPVRTVAADAALASGDAAGRAGLLGHELLNEFLESNIHDYRPKGCYGPCGDIPGTPVADRVACGSCGAITPQSDRDRNKLHAAQCMNIAGRGRIIAAMRVCRRPSIYGTNYAPGHRDVNDGQRRVGHQGYRPRCSQLAMQGLARYQHRSLSEWSDRISGQDPLRQAARRSRGRRE